jgi:hypothetical protein
MLHQHHGMHATAVNRNDWPNGGLEISVAFLLLLVLSVRFYVYEQYNSDWKTMEIHK